MDAKTDVIVSVDFASFSETRFVVEMKRCWQIDIGDVLDFTCCGGESLENNDRL